MTDEFDSDPIARELRASLERHAREAPRGDMLAERIIHSADRASAERARPPWRTWLLPLVAAAAVAGVVAAIIGIQGYETHPVANGRTSVPLPTGPASQVPFTPHTESPGAPNGSGSARNETAKLHAVKIVDLSFVSDTEGWALGTAQCIQLAGRCTALFHTKGEHWWSLPNSTPFNVPGVREGCATRCVTNIRFANAQVGYVYGPSAFLMTKDGGKHWAEQPGGAIALESLDDNVIRVTATSDSGCPGPCGVQVETAPIGSAKWTMSDLQPVSGAGVEFSRGQPSNAYLLVKRNPAGGAQDQTSTLYRSTDNGSHWTSVGEPCMQTNGEADSYAVAGGEDNRVSVLCRFRAEQSVFITTSTDGGRTFLSEFAKGATVPADAQLLAGDAGTVLVTAGDGLARSTNGGGTFQKVPSVTTGISFVGFESDTVGRAVSADGNTIWTTRDAGQSWQSATFG